MYEELARSRTSLSCMLHGQQRTLYLMRILCNYSLRDILLRDILSGIVSMPQRTQYVISILPKLSVRDVLFQLCKRGWAQSSLQPPPHELDNVLEFNPVQIDEAKHLYEQLGCLDLRILHLELHGVAFEGTRTAYRTYDL